MRKEDDDLYGKVLVTIEGRTEILMNKPDPEKFKGQRRAKIRTTVYDHAKEAKEGAYIAEIEGKQQLYIPSEWIYSMMIGAAAFYRIQRMSLRSVLAGSITIEPDKIPLGTDKYEVDERFVNIQGKKAWKGRAKVCLPWKTSFYIVYDKTMITDELLPQLRTILEDGGRRKGIGDFRPEHTGRFGTFFVTDFKPIVSKSKGKNKD